MSIQEIPQVVKWRRYLHMNPELSFHEKNTSQFVYDTLLSFGNLEVSRPTTNSVMARLMGAEEGKIIALRADMDALPITEENEFDFVSQKSGVMHACGHDGHTSTLLRVAQLLSNRKNEIHGEVRFLFQHGEEVFPGGAQEMVDAGVMENVDYVIGAHLWSPLEIGQIGIVYGPAMASPDEFNITIKGKGGHAAAPHETIDSIVIGSQIVNALQTVVSRYTDPIDKLVLSITQFHAGTTHNVIPNSATLNGTVRSFSQSLSQQTNEQIERIVKGITATYGATYNYSYKPGYAPVINDDTATKILEDTVVDVLGVEHVTHLTPSMGGEDFSAYLQKAPGCFFFIGARNEEKGITYPHHHPKFTIDEDALEIGVKIFTNAVFRFLKPNEK